MPLPLLRREPFPKLRLALADLYSDTGRDAEAERTMDVVKRVMVSAPEPVVKLSVPLQVDARAAQNWEAAH